jgi:predicted DNA-binding transcriptional regulator AlpA
MDPVFTQRETSNYIKVPIPTLERWRQTGGGPRWVRLGARRVAYRLSDIEEWLEQRTYRHRAEELAQKAGC